MDTQAAFDIAIIGTAGRFPGAASVMALWANVRDGVESVRPLTEAELTAAGVPKTLRDDPAYVAARGVLEDALAFDAPLFGYTPQEAAAADPQQRLFLETCHAALDDGGYGQPDGLRVGVFGGTGTSDYAGRADPRVPDTVMREVRARLERDPDFLTTNVSYRLDLRGPSVDVQTACSTSAVAIHLACQSLLVGESDLALAGGVSVGIPQEVGYRYEREGIASPDGRCRAFDAAAGGTVTGGGVAVLLLRPLTDALAAGDPIRAVIKATAVNNDGAAKVGFAAPSVDGQAAVIAQAQSLAGVAPATVTYVEAHGTGTPLGDAVELRALCRAFAGAGRGFCGLGSLKPNVGHLDAAAGAASVIKVVLAMEHCELPPTLHFARPNPEIDWVDSPFYVVAGRAAWEAPGPRRAGVNCFGVGGTNVHLVLEAAPEPARTATPPAEPELLVLSAATPTALAASRHRLAAALEDSDLALPHVAHTLQVGRRAHRWRAAGVVADLAAARAKLIDAAALVRGDAAARGADDALAVLLPSQCHGSDAEWSALYRRYPAARDTLAASASAPRELARPVALARVWRELGVHARWFAGEGGGAWAAAVLADAVTFEAAARGFAAGVAPPGLPPAPATAPTVVLDSPSRDTMLRLAGELWVQGLDIDWPALRGARACRVRLPGYPYERVEHRRDPTPSVVSKPAGDRAEAPAPTATPPTPAPTPAPAPSATAVPPRTPTERDVAAIWEAFFGVRPIGVDDSFFAMGGNSLRAFALAEQLRAGLTCSLTVRDVLEAPTIAALALRVAPITGPAAPPPATPLAAGDHQVGAMLTPLPATAETPAAWRQLLRQIAAAEAQGLRSVTTPTWPMADAGEAHPQPWLAGVALLTATERVEVRLAVDPGAIPDVIAHWPALHALGGDRLAVVLSGGDPSPLEHAVRRLRADLGSELPLWVLAGASEPRWKTARALRLNVIATLAAQPPDRLVARMLAHRGRGRVAVTAHAVDDTSRPDAATALQAFARRVVATCQQDLATPAALVDLTAAERDALVEVAVGACLDHGLVRLTDPDSTLAPLRDAGLDELLILVGDPASAPHALTDLLTS
ncbi:MAG: beta-ketoacyl synthase N-terminal-like domain-containing protein [Planctomycetota bacterium]